MLRLTGLLLSVLSLLAACSPGNTNVEPTPEPIDLVLQAAEKIRSSETFRLEITQSGAPYFIQIDLGDGVVPVTFRRAVGQYVFPDLMEARIRLIAAGLPLDVDIFSEGDDQWFRAFFTANQWLNQSFAAGFNPAVFIAEETGFQAVLGSLLNLGYIGTEALEDGAQVHHLAGRADGQGLSSLMVGLIQFEGVLPVDVFIDTETGFPARIVVTQPETIAEDEPQPSTWRIDVFDIGAEPEINNPGA